LNKVFIDELTITEKVILSPVHTILNLRVNKISTPISPGQFINIQIGYNNSKILRRPFSIFDIDPVQKTLSLFIKIIGSGSRFICNKAKGDKLDVIYPLGNGFSLSKNKNVLLVGGGFGVAPLYFLSKELIKRGNIINLLVGADSAKNIHLTDFFHQSIRIYITTDDGSQGEKGKVTDHNMLRNCNFDVIYTCGPMLMMKAIAAFAKLYNISCEVSLDHLMACGFGTCLCCVVKTTDGNLCTCTEGPVFNISKLIW